MKYRIKKGEPVKREEVERLNGLVRRLFFTTSSGRTCSVFAVLAVSSSSRSGFSFPVQGYASPQFSQNEGGGSVSMYTTPAMCRWPGI